MCSPCASSCCKLKSADGDDDGLTRMLVFGITGMTGGSVAEAARCSTWYRVTGFTRREDGVVFDDIIAKGTNLITGDMLQSDTVEAAMAGIDVVFLNTFYWDFMDPLVELKQGTNVVDAAMKYGVKHLIYAGTDYNTLTAQVHCPYLEGKAMVADYIISVGIPYTIVRMGFFFENFISVFRPHPLTRYRFAITIPIHSVPINCGSIQDFGQCIARIGLRPGTYAYTIIHLATEYLTVSMMVQSFNNSFNVGGKFLDAKFLDGRVPTKAYKAFNFRGSDDLTAAFCHYRTQLEWDYTHVKTLCTHPLTLDEWVQRNEKTIQSTLDEVYSDVFGDTSCNTQYRRAGEDVVDKIRYFTDELFGTGTKKKSKKVGRQPVTVLPLRHTMGGSAIDKMGTLLGVFKESQL